MESDSLRDGLLALASLELLPPAERRLAEEAADKLAGSGMYVAVIGEFKRGKSTLINALLGAALLPTGILPVTAVPTLVRFGLRPRATLRFIDRPEVEVEISALHEYLTEGENPHNAKQVREALIEYPAALLKSGIILVDTPGTGSVHLHNTEAAAAFLPRIDVALLVIGADAPLSESETRLLVDAADTAVSIAVCLNKVDILTPSETREALEFVRPRVATLCGTRDTMVFAVSAREANTEGEGDLMALRSWLERDIAGAQSHLVVERGRRLAARQLSLVEAALDLEAAAAAKPAQEAAAARHAFAAAREALAASTDEQTTLLLAACKRTTETVIEPSAARLRESLTAALIAGPDEEWSESLAAAANTWRREVPAAVAAAIRGPIDRHAERMRELGARFVEQVGQAFGVKLPVSLDIAPRVHVDAVQLDLADEEGALAMGVRHIRTLAPGGAGRRWRDRARRERAIADADRLAGRLRYATVQAVDRTARQWIREAAAASDALGDALTGAVARAEHAAETRAPRPPDVPDVRARVESVRLALQGD